MLKVGPFRECQMFLPLPQDCCCRSLYWTRGSPKKASARRFETCGALWTICSLSTAVTVNHTWGWSSRRHTSIKMSVGSVRSGSLSHLKWMHNGSLTCHSAFLSASVCPITYAERITCSPSTIRNYGSGRKDCAILCDKFCQYEELAGFTLYLPTWYRLGTLQGF